MEIGRNQGKQEKRKLNINTKTNRGRQMKGNTGRRTHEEKKEGLQEID